MKNINKTTWIWLAVAAAAIILIWYFFIRETETEAAARVMQNETQRRMGSFSNVIVPKKRYPIDVRGTTQYCDSPIETNANGVTYCPGQLYDNP